MLFNSFEFLVFLLLTFILYWLIKDHLKLQNLFLLVISYIFYGWWDYSFLSLLAFSSLVDFLVGRQLSTTEDKNKRKALLGISIMVNLGLLGFFKYYNFFVGSFVEAFSSIGIELNVNTLKIILPVGISFYTFQTLSYTIDMYRGKFKPKNDVIAFFAYVSFFPQLVAGPIERASNLLPQFYRKREFSYSMASDGMRQILWGFFKKIVIADGCAVVVDTVFPSYNDYNGSTLFLATILFAFQIYGDFSGYSDIAIGTAKLFGFRLMQNFSVPYFSRDIAEFWRRWHISLTTWFRDYLYFPIGGSRGTRNQTIRNTFIIFIVSGFWHGANWTFIFWGFLNALFFIPLLLIGSNRKHLKVAAHNSSLPDVYEVLGMVKTFLLVCLTWIFFRADSIGTGFHVLLKIFSGSFFELPAFKSKIALLLPLIMIMLVLEWINRRQAHQLQIARYPQAIRHFTYVFVFLLIFFFGKYSSNSFIYFQF